MTSTPETTVASTTSTTPTTSTAPTTMSGIQTKAAFWYQTVTGGLPGTDICWLPPKIASAEMAIRPSSKVLRNWRNPSPRRPSRLASGTRQPAKDRPCVSEACQPSLS